jgi:hypothetical protein
MRRDVLVFAVLVALLHVSIGASRQDVRDPRTPARTGASVRGQVIAADTGQPVQRIAVRLTLIGGPDTPAAGPHSLARLTDVQGHFEFTGLPAGYYRLTCDPGRQYQQYLATSYGQRSTTGGGVPFELTAGQTLDNANIVLPRAGVIAGRITDGDGEPMGRVQVSVFLFPPGSQVPRPEGERETDDRGQFRIFGLRPGDYAVASRGWQESPPPGAADDFLLTYYPGVASLAEAQRLHVDSGGEISGIDIQVLRGRLFTVSGVVLDSHGRPARWAYGSVEQTGRPGLWAPVANLGTDRDGRFTVQVPAGTYRIKNESSDSGAGASNIGTAAPARKEVGFQDLTVASDLTDVAVAMQPGLTIAGRVIRDDGAPIRTATPIQIGAVAAVGQRVSSEGTLTAVSEAGTFALPPLFGPVIVTVAHLPRGLAVKRISAAGTDITDRQHEFTARESGHLEIVLTSHPAVITGSVRDPHGNAVLDCTVVLLLADPDARHARATAAYRAVSPDPRGSYGFDDLHAGSYLVAAVDSDRVPLEQDAADAVAATAAPVTLRDGEHAMLDLTVASGSR